MGDKQVGLIGALTILSKGSKILSAVSYSDNLTRILTLFGISVYKTINNKGFLQKLSESDIFFSVHGREIIKASLLGVPKYGAINIHPYLYKYKGANPVERALNDGEFRASVGAHIMEEGIDQGKVLLEEFVDVTGSNSVEEIYNRLYPFYCSVISKVLDTINDEYKKNEK